MIKTFFVLLLNTPILNASQNNVPILIKVQNLLESPSKFMTYDQDKRFIWTCFQIKNPQYQLMSNIVMQNSDLCLCQPGGDVDGIGLQVSHVLGIDITKSEHLGYREIFLENHTCQSFAAYSP